MEVGTSAQEQWEMGMTDQWTCFKCGVTLALEEDGSWKMTADAQSVSIEDGVAEAVYCTCGHWIYWIDERGPLACTFQIEE